jgi:hypothetical protein
MKRSYEIDYHARNIQRQLSQIIKNDAIVDMMDITIRFVTEMLATDNSYCDDLSVMLLYDDNEIELMFLCKTVSYEHLISEVHLGDGIKQFFEYYYDEIFHECSNGRSKLIFRIALPYEKDTWA